MADPHRAVTTSALRRLAVLLVLATQAGCGTVVFNRPKGPEIDFMSRTEFRGYTERVFRHHNRVQSDLMMLLVDLEESNSEHYQRLMRAEEPMREACQPLNDAVASYMEEGEIGFFRRLRLPMSVTDCERQTLRVEALLDQALGVI